MTQIDNPDSFSNQLIHTISGCLQGDKAAEQQLSLYEQQQGMYIEN